ncbi:hypothetical protein T4B_5972 [Trichinella pseudospiralis]|uniref:Uncharacterized protein n=2 Tax=Trichinella pseudospiralis TaxID=6337 RepID=A0A0V1DMK1_TRIPS|nr:hypothetical protein T4D_9210 [Trichinella pseudospiralis]KRY62702.1 hypothetical protein T4A_3569 [Trichinella pseudospiralis]KRY96006.1 hypothetical protein T4B_5972 [Trichinella pseudospiralis]KRY97516.1 hypothetical protein T4C_7532 [Trichinella pseudospiralis]
MNRNTHGEERRKVEKAKSMERLGWIESLVSIGTLDVEDTVCRSRV